MSEPSRRELLKSAVRAGVALGFLERATSPARADDGPPTPLAGTTPEQLAQDEIHWDGVRARFALGADILNLNNGGLSPAPRVVIEAVTRALELQNRSPMHTLWRVQEPVLETVRARLAALAGTSPECLAITRNASEALAIAQLGLTLAPGDEVLTTEQDYPRTLMNWRQRVRRDGVVLKTISVAGAALPDRPDEIAAQFEQAITAKTKALLFCHVLGTTGRVLPTREICQMARAKGVTSIVDGAHAFAHIPLELDQLECDFYATSLHKWFLGPIGTGFLYVRRDRLKNHWPLFSATAEQDDLIKKMEEIGTHPAAAHNALLEAATFHDVLGLERKRARLRFLRDRWTKRLSQLRGARVTTSPDALQAPGIGLLAVDGIEPTALAAALFERHRILVSPVAAPGIAGIRVTPTVSTSAAEIDVFGEAVEREAARRR